MKNGRVSTPEPRSCVVCGRSITWRRTWERDWESVRYCSAACRTHPPDDTDRSLEATITALLDNRARDASICPSEAARAVGGEDWRLLMEPARRAARRLVGEGRVEITQGGKVVDPSTAKGPIRIRRVN